MLPAAQRLDLLDGAAGAVVGAEGFDHRVRQHQRGEEGGLKEKADGEAAAAADAIDDGDGDDDADEVADVEQQECAVLERGALAVQQPRERARPPHVQQHGGARQRRHQEESERQKSAVAADENAHAAAARLGVLCRAARADAVERRLLRVGGERHRVCELQRVRLCLRPRRAVGRVDSLQHSGGAGGSPPTSMWRGLSGAACHRKSKRAAPPSRGPPVVAQRRRADDQDRRPVGQPSDIDAVSGPRPIVGKNSAYHAVKRERMIDAAADCTSAARAARPRRRPPSAA